MAHGIKEITDVFYLLKEFAEAIKHAKANGTIDIFDLLSLDTVDVVKAAVTAMQGSGDIAAELADLNKEEIQELITIALDASKSLLDVIVET